MNNEVQHLVDDLIPQARAEAWRAFNSARHAVSRDEMESVAYLGLMQAANRWPAYTASRGFDAGCGDWPCSRPDTCGTRWFAAYCLRRMRGAILDSQRSADWVPRTVRQNAKALRDAGEGSGATEAELSERTNLDVATVRATQSAVAMRPVSIDDETGRDVASPAGTESEAAAGRILAAVVSAMRTLPVMTQVILAMRYFESRDQRDIAETTGLRESQVAQLHQEGVIAVHRAMAESARES